MNKLFASFIFFFLTTFCVFGTIEIRSTQLTIADGLANNTVRHFMQDSKGFIWLGTLNGLNRYDGNSFLTYKLSTEEYSLMAGRKVYNLQEDKNGFLWIYFSSEQYSCFDLKRAHFVDFTGNGETFQKYSKSLLAKNGDVWLWHDENGARKIVYENNRFRSVTYKKEKQNLPANMVNFISEGLDSSVWIGTSRGLVKIDHLNETVIDEKLNFHHMILYGNNTYFFTNDNAIYHFDKSTSRLLQIAKLPFEEQSVTGYFLYGNQWIIFTQQGVFCYDFLDKEIKADPVFLGENIQSGNVLTDNKGNYWIYNHTGNIWYLNEQNGIKKHFTLIPSEKMGYIDLERFQVVHGSRDIIWISTYGNGLYAYDLLKDELSHFTAAKDGINHIGSDYLLGVMEDRSGEIWVSSEFSGVSRISIINEGAYRYFPESLSKLDRSNTIRLVSKIDDDIWIGTRQGGLYVYDAQFRLKHSRNDYSANIYAVVKDGSGKIWMGSRGDGVCIDNVWYKHDPTNPASISNNHIFCLFKDSKQRIWIGTFNGGLDLAVKDGLQYRFLHFLNRTYGQRQVRTICEDKNGMIWVGTSEGIYIFDPDMLIKDPEHFYHYSYDAGQLYSDEIKYLYSDSKGQIWVSTAGAGFSICSEMDDYNSLSFTHYSTKDGLCNDIVQSITEDQQGNVWLATEYGISKYIPAENIFENYYMSAYSQGNVYTEGAVCRCNDQSILFGSNYGFVVFKPEEVRKIASSFPVVFTNLNINGADVHPDDPDSPLLQSLEYTNEIRLKHNRNSVQVDFSSFNYVDGGQTKYSYRLVNYDTDWSTPSQLNFAAYKMLPPGQYILEVKSANSSGVWNDHISSLKITIERPFYLTVWAFLLYVLITALALFFTIRVIRNFNRLNNKIEIEKQLTEYKLVFFTNISHEFRTPLTLIQGALDRIRRLDISSKDLVPPIQTMENSTNRLLRLIDQLLEFRKMQNNKLALALEKTDVIAMLYEIFMSFGDMADSKNMNFRFMPSVASLSMYIDKEKLDKMVYNLLSNAFKYTPHDGEICLIINEKAEQKKLEIRVTDTGVGIPVEKRDELFKRFMQSSFSGNSVGVGLHLTFELVQVHKGEITYVENPGGGSVFTIKLPLEQSVYEEKDFLIPNRLIQSTQEPFMKEDDISADAFNAIISDPLNKHQILIIEDDTDICRYLKEELSAYFHVEVANNGTDGFQMANETTFDLIVCDVMMPGMNGYEVTRKLKAEFQTCHIPVILLTALNMPENHLEGIESGADAYLSKPFSIRLLLTRIVKLLEQRERLKEKFSEEPGIIRSAVYASDRDKQFVERLHKVLLDNLNNPNFSVDEFASVMQIGRTLFYRKVKGVTGYSPNEYLRIMRMKKAAELLLTDKYTVSEVSYQVGMEDPFYFSKCFKAQFGIAPSVYKGKGFSKTETEA